jgi:hypothetical protein
VIRNGRITVADSTGSEARDWRRKSLNQALVERLQEVLDKEQIRTSSHRTIGRTHLSQSSWECGSGCESAAVWLNEHRLCLCVLKAIS